MCAHGPVRGASWSFVSIGLFMRMNGVRLLPLTPAQSAVVVAAVIVKGSSDDPVAALVALAGYFLLPAWNYAAPLRDTSTSI